MPQLHNYLHARAVVKMKVGDNSGAQSDLEEEKRLSASAQGSP
jgi:hypothetical protein